MVRYSTRRECILIQFEWTINLGTLLHLTGFLFTAVLIYIRVRDRLATIEARLEILMHWYNRNVNE